MSRKRNEDTIISNPLASREESFRFLSSIFTPQIEPEVISMVIEAYDYDDLQNGKWLVDGFCLFLVSALTQRHNFELHSGVGIDCRQILISGSHTAVERSMDELMVMSSQASADVTIEQLAVEDSAALPSTDKFSSENHYSFESNVAESHENVPSLSKHKIQPCSVASEADKSVEGAKISQKIFQLDSTACFSEKNLPGEKQYSHSKKLEKSVENNHLITHFTQKDKKLYSKAATLSKDCKSSAERKIDCVDDGLDEQTKELKTVKSSQICYSPNRNPIFTNCNYSFPNNGVQTKSKFFRDKKRHSPLQNSTDQCHQKNINTALNIKFAPANGIFWSSSEEKCTMTRFDSDIETKKQIKNQLRKKTRILIILRGLPGSGKSTLARKLVFNGAIFNTDDYFIQNGVYCFIKSYVGEAHAWNQSRAKNAMAMGVSPVIIDNTNVMFWEMDPYISWGRKKKYDIIVLEPFTWWKFKTNELAIRNSHDVPKEKIREMLERYETIHPNSFAKHELILKNKCDSLKDTVTNSDCQKKILEDKNNHHQYLSDPSVKNSNHVCIKQKVSKTADSKTSDVKILSPTPSKESNAIISEIISDLKIYKTLTRPEKCSGDATSSIECTSENEFQTSKQDKYETKSLISGDSKSCGFISLDAQTYEAFDTTAMISPNMQCDPKGESIDIGAKDMNINVPFWQNEYDEVQKLTSSEGINASNTLTFPHEIKPIEGDTSIEAIIHNEENFANNQPSKLELKTTIDPNQRLTVPKREMEEKLMNAEILQNISSFGVKHDLCTESSKFNIKINAENKNLMDKCLVTTDEEFESKNENSPSFKIAESQSIKKSHCFSDKNKDLKFEICNSIQNKLDTEFKEKKISQNCLESRIINDSVNNLKENLNREDFFVSSDDQDSEFETIDIPESNTDEDLSKINFCSLLSIDSGINDLCNSFDKNLINDSNMNDIETEIIEENDDCISSYPFQDNILSWNEITEPDNNFYWKNMSENDQYVSANEILNISEKSSASKDLSCIKKSFCKKNTSGHTNIILNENKFLKSDAHRTANRSGLLAKENDSSTSVSSSSEYNLDSQSSVSSVSKHNPDSQPTISSTSNHNLNIKSLVSSASDINLNNSNPKPQRLGLQKISILDKCPNFSVCNSEEDQEQFFETGDWNQEADFKNVDKPVMDDTHQQPKPPRNFSKVTKKNCSNNELRKFDAEIKSRLFANIFDCLKSQYTDSLNWLVSPVSNSKFSFYNNFEEVMDIMAQKIEAFSCSEDFEKLRHFLADSTDQSETVNSNIKLLARSILSDVFPSIICSSTSIESLLSDKFVMIDNKSVTNGGTEKESPSVSKANETRDNYLDNIKVSSKCEDNDHTSQEGLNKLFFECPSNLLTATCETKESIPLISKNKLRKIKIEKLCIKNLEQTLSVDSPSPCLDNYINSDTDSTTMDKSKELIVKKSEAIINNSSDNMVCPNLIELTNEENIPKQQTTILKYQKELDLYLSEENNTANTNSINSENCILYPSNLKPNLSMHSSNANSESLVIENTEGDSQNSRDDIQTADLEFQESEVCHSPHPCNKLLDQDSSVKNNLKDGSHFAELKHLFPHVANDDLEHILEVCHGDKTWATNILLDSNHVKLDSVKLAVSEQENSTDEDSSKCRLQKEMQVPLPDVVKSREIASQNQPTTFQPEKLFFTLDPILALQLEELFGPINRSQSDDDRIVEIDYDFMKSLYTQWKQTLQCRNKESAVQSITSLSHANKSDALAKLIPPKPKEPRNLNEIMENEVELQSYKIEKLKKDKNLAIMKSRLQLYKAYPGAEPTVLDSIFDNNNHNLTDTLKILGAPVSRLEEVCNSVPLVPSHSESASKIDTLQSEFEGNGWHSWVPEFELQNPTPSTQFSTISDAAIALRKEAMHQYTLSKKSLEKAKRYFQEGNEMAGSYYTAESKRFKIKFKDLNKEASQLISQERNNGMRRLQLDLHGLYVSEALPLLTERLKELLREPKTSWTTFKVITGQGKHSERGPKLHFSVMEFLKKNGHEFTVPNAGTVDVLLPPKER